MMHKRVVYKVLLSALGSLVVFAALIVPGVVRAQDVVVGGVAVIAADGDGLLLRDGPGYDANPIELYPDGTTVAVIDGPITAEDGSQWFVVEANGQSGYMVADWLVGPGSPVASSDGDYCDGAQEYIDVAALRSDLMRIHGHDVKDFGGRMSPMMSQGLAASLLHAHADEMSWASEAWPDWYWPTYDMMDAFKNVIEWKFSYDPNVVSSPDRNNHPAGSYENAVAWADETEQRYIEASERFIAQCGLVWPQLPPDPYDYIR